MKLLINTTLILSLLACSSTTIVKTDDPEVNIFIDGESQGKGAIVHTDKKVVWMSITVKLQKDGCQDQYESFSKDEQFDVLPFVGGLFLIVPFLWTMKYDAVHQYNFVCKK